jgi:hypothetical protein
VVTRRKSGPNYLGVGTITIHDNLGNPVAGATVFATATGPVPGTYSGPTGADGTVTFETGGMKKPTGEWCFEVTDVTHATLTYDPGSNVVTLSCESGDVNREVFETSSAPSRFDVGCYPNPFNPMTTIHFSLPAAARVRLEIFDVAGHRVAELADRSFGAGRHSVDWNATDRPSGVYFYRLTAGNKVVTDKVMLLK